MKLLPKSVLLNLQSVVAIATTPQSAQRLYSLVESWGITLMVSPSCHQMLSTQMALEYQVYQGSLAETLPFLWSKHEALILGLALGAVVRLIAPLLEDKGKDPAVLVVDALGNHVISVCGGHQGGGNALTRLVAAQLGAHPIITGASEALGVPAIDTLGLPFGWRRGSGDWRGVSAALAQQQRVQVIQEAGSTLWQQHLPKHHSFEFSLDATPIQGRVWISATQRQFAPYSDFPRVQWHPRVLWVGIGCERGTEGEVISQALHRVLAQAHLAAEAIAGIATLDRKADEPALLALAETKGWPIKIYTSDQLQEVSVPNPSAVVAATVGTPSVAEAAALLAAEVGQLLVTKQVYRFPPLSGAVTVAIAQSIREYTGKSGKLWLVGMGPGALEQMTPAAQTAAIAADVILGYGLYLDLIAPLQRPGQIIETFALTQEKQRAQRGIELAQWGLTVAVISSGDCGIYGMAGLVLEELQHQGIDECAVEVKVFPGISALQAAAAKVGAPLMHDFCAISLSDLLTPWPVIEKRLVAAAQGDFVTAIYNPKSQKRTEAIDRTQGIFLQYRDRQTPVALVRCAYRDQEEVTLTTLAEFAQLPIDMLTTVLIGNESTRIYGSWMITPRGYPH